MKLRKRNVMLYDSFFRHHPFPCDASKIRSLYIRAERKFMELGHRDV